MNRFAISARLARMGFLFVLSMLVLISAATVPAAERRLPQGDPLFTFVQMSDSHITADGMRTNKPAGNVAERLKLAIGEINALKPDLVIVTGDLVELGTGAEYDTFCRLMSELQFPWHAVPGNHETMEGSWADYEKRIGKPLHYSFEHKDCQFILLNGSRDEKKYYSAGFIDDAQLQWCEEEMKKGKDRLYSFLVCHFPLEAKWKGVGVENPARDKLTALLQEHKVAGFLFGHRHGHDYSHANGTTHVLCAAVGWNFRCEAGYRIYRVYPEMTISEWKLLGDRPLRFAMTIPNPRRLALGEDSIHIAEKPVVSPVVEPEKVCHLRLEQVTGTLFPDYSGSGNNGVFSCMDWLGPRWVTGRMGGALALNGLDDHVKVDRTEALDMGTGPFTVAFWFRKSDPKDTFLSILYKQKPGGFKVPGFGFMLRETGGQLKFTLGDAKNAIQASGPAISDRTWHHAAGVRANGKIRLFLDGTLAAETADTLGDITNECPLLIGRGGCGNNVGGPSGADAWNGELDDVRIYRRGLSPEEIARLSAGNDKAGGM